ncbi:hypothetical protein VP01_143g2 [Puccinia sorghi]|uniref:Uncharacterized protein n=1 Tax=Puccinia sorghi TaxID=27349 RepID=A0A0L6VKT1_9BASI|nr:hypothetical protein VP01_143g2 [Puccinia sorghi]
MSFYLLSRPSLLSLLSSVFCFVFGLDFFLFSRREEGKNILCKGFQKTELTSSFFSCSLFLLAMSVTFESLLKKPTLHFFYTLAVFFSLTLKEKLAVLFSFPTHNLAFPECSAKANGQGCSSFFFCMSLRDSWYSSTELPSKLHMFAYVDVLAQSLCSLHSDCASKLAFWEFLYVNCEQLSKFLLQCVVENILYPPCSQILLHEKNLRAIIHNHWNNILNVRGCLYSIRPLNVVAEAMPPDRGAMQSLVFWNHIGSMRGIKIIPNSKKDRSLARWVQYSSSLLFPLLLVERPILNQVKIFLICLVAITVFLLCLGKFSLRDVLFDGETERGERDLLSNVTFSIREGYQDIILCYYFPTSSMGRSCFLIKISYLQMCYHQLIDLFAFEQIVHAYLFSQDEEGFVGWGLKLGLFNYLPIVLLWITYLCVLYFLSLALIWGILSLIELPVVLAMALFLEMESLCCLNWIALGDSPMYNGQERNESWRILANPILLSGKLMRCSLVLALTIAQHPVPTTLIKSTRNTTLVSAKCLLVNLKLTSYKYQALGKLIISFIETVGITNHCFVIWRVLTVLDIQDGFRIGANKHQGFSNPDVRNCFGFSDHLKRIECGIKQHNYNMYHALNSNLLESLRPSRAHTLGYNNSKVLRLVTNSWVEIIHGNFMFKGHKRIHPLPITHPANIIMRDDMYHSNPGFGMMKFGYSDEMVTGCELQQQIIYMHWLLTLLLSFCDLVSVLCDGSSSLVRQVGHVACTPACSCLCQCILLELRHRVVAYRTHLEAQLDLISTPGMSTRLTRIVQQKNDLRFASDEASARDLLVIMIPDDLMDWRIDVQMLMALPETSIKSSRCQCLEGTYQNSRQINIFTHKREYPDERRYKYSIRRLPFTHTLMFQHPPPLSPRLHAQHVFPATPVREELATPLSEGPSGRFLKPLIGNRKMDCKRKGELTSVRVIILEEWKSPDCLLDSTYTVQKTMYITARGIAGLHLRLCWTLLPDVTSHNLVAALRRHCVNVISPFSDFTSHDGDIASPGSTQPPTEVVVSSCVPSGTSVSRHNVGIIRSETNIQRYVLRHCSGGGGYNVAGRHISVDSYPDWVDSSYTTDGRMVLRSQMKKTFAGFSNVFVQNLNLSVNVFKMLGSPNIRKMYRIRQSNVALHLFGTENVRQRPSSDITSWSHLQNTSDPFDQSGATEGLQRNHKATPSKDDETDNGSKMASGELESSTIRAVAPSPIPKVSSFFHREPFCKYLLLRIMTFDYKHAVYFLFLSLTYVKDKKKLHITLGIPSFRSLGLMRSRQISSSCAGAYELEICVGFSS